MIKDLFLILRRRTSSGEIGEVTSPLVTLPACIFWGFCLLAALSFGSAAASGLFFFLLCLAILTRCWGKIAIHRVSLSMDCSRPHLFPGEETVLTYRVVNDKLLPLPWLEIDQNSPPWDCLEPDEAFDRVHIPGSPEDAPPVLRQSLPMVGSHRDLTVTHTWKALRRGLYPITAGSARSGDGFGLVQKEARLPLEKAPTIAVYPAYVEVDISPFRQNLWDVAAGRNGFQEDRTVLRGNREYQPGDPWKAINWRLAAKDQGLPINLYQTIRPTGMRLILDGESYAGYEKELERALEILGSLLLDLTAAGLQPSLSLSASRRMSARTLCGEENGDISPMMLALAGFECLAVPADPDGTPADRKRMLPSVFPQDVVPETGSIWVFTRSGDTLPEDLLARLPQPAAHLLLSSHPEIPERLGWRSFSLEDMVRDHGKEGSYG